MEVLADRSPRPIAVAAAVGILLAGFLLRMWMWWLAVDWNVVKTYTSFVYLGPFSLFLIWTAYRGRNWGRWLLAILYMPTLLSWTSAMLTKDYSLNPILSMSYLLVLQASAILLLFLPRSNAWFLASAASANKALQATANTPHN